MAIERFKRLIRNTMIGAIISAGIFGLASCYQASCKGREEYKLAQIPNKIEYAEKAKEKIDSFFSDNYFSSDEMGVVKDILKDCRIIYSPQKYVEYKVLENSLGFGTKESIEEQSRLRSLENEMVCLHDETLLPLNLSSARDKNGLPYTWNEFKKVIEEKYDENVRGKEADLHNRIDSALDSYVAVLKSNDYKEVMQPLSARERFFQFLAAGWD